MTESFDRKFRFWLCILNFGGGGGVENGNVVSRPKQPSFDRLLTEFLFGRGWAGLGWAGWRLEAGLGTLAGWAGWAGWGLAGPGWGWRAGLGAGLTWAVGGWAGRPGWAGWEGWANWQARLRGLRGAGWGLQSRMYAVTAYNFYLSCLEGLGFRV